MTTKPFCAECGSAICKPSHVGPKPCRACNGAGSEAVACDQGQHGFRIDCGACNGTGRVKEEPKPEATGLNLTTLAFGVVLAGLVGPTMRKKATPMARRLPDKIYVETWPEESGKDTAIHFEQVGYGIDMADGWTSRITVYQRVKPAKKKVRR